MISKPRLKKQAIVSRITNDLSKPNLAVVCVQFDGLNEAELSTLRKDARMAGTKLTVVKKNLAKLALKSANYGPISEEPKGHTLIAYSAGDKARAVVVMEEAKKRLDKNPSGGKIYNVAAMIGDCHLSESSRRSIASYGSLEGIYLSLISMLKQAPVRLIAMLKAIAERK